MTMDFIGDKSQFYDKGLDPAVAHKMECSNGHTWHAVGDFEESGEDRYVSFVPCQGEDICPECGERGWLSE